MYKAKSILNISGMAHKQRLSLFVLIFLFTGVSDCYDCYLDLRGMHEYSQFICDTLVFWCLFVTGSHYLILASLKFIMLTKAASNSQEFSFDGGSVFISF